MLSNNENDCFGNYKLSILKIEQQNEMIKIFECGENISIVEKNWFDEFLTGRKIKIL